MGSRRLTGGPAPVPTEGSSDGPYDPRYNKSIGVGGLIAYRLMWSTKETT